LTTFPAADNVNWKDVTPRLAAVYDVFGNGKTAIKTSLSKYLTGLGTFSFFQSNEVTSAPSPIASLVTGATRSWVDGNQNFVPDCDLSTATPGANGTGGDLCGPISDPGFGTVRPNVSFPADLRNGWNKRGYNWEFSLGVQQELAARTSIEVSYFRRWYGNFYVNHDIGFSGADLTFVDVKVPTDPDLPNSGQTLSVPTMPRETYIASLFGIRPSQWIVENADKYGDRTEHWNGFDVNLNSRIKNGLIVQGGFSTGRTLINNCDIVKNPALATLNLVGEAVRLPALTFFTRQPQSFCDNVNVGSGQATGAFVTQVKFLAAYTIPRVDLLVSGTFQSLPGPQLQAIYNAPETAVPLLLSDVAPGAPPIVLASFPGPVQIVPAGTFGDRLNQVDFRVGKIFKVGRSRTSVNLDIYNAFNSNAVLTQNDNFAVWRLPTGVLQARFFKVSAQFDF
jgi:hypothetical protein